MNRLNIVCYGDKDECKYYSDGWCSLYDRCCGQIHIDMIREDGEE